ncbi:Mss4-like protein [Aspergillus crustosus]
MLYNRASSSLRTLNTLLSTRCTKQFTRPFSSTHTFKMPEKDHGYKDRPPYQIRSDKELGPIKWRASCNCGKVTYKINRQEPLTAKYCHCRGCQKTHGAPFQWCGVFHKSDLVFTKGTEGLSFYSSQDKSRDYQLPTKVACDHCRSPIMDEGRNVCLIFPELIDYEESGTDHDTWRKAFEPKYVPVILNSPKRSKTNGCRMHIFYTHRAMDVPDGKPKWAGLDEKSDALDDHGNPKDDSSRI